MGDLCATGKALEEIADRRDEHECALAANNLCPDDLAVKLKLNGTVEKYNLAVHAVTPERVTAENAESFIAETLTQSNFPPDLLPAKDAARRTPAKANRKLPSQDCPSNAPRPLPSMALE